MAVAANNTISKTELLNRFGVVARDYIVANTNWDANTVIKTQTAYNITRGLGPQNPNGSNAPGVLPSGKALAGTNPGLPSASSPDLVSDDIVANLADATSITQIFRDFMIVYARNQKVNFNNTGNTSPGISTGVIRLTTSNGLDATITNQVNAAVASRSLVADTVVDASLFEAFFLDCRNIWAANCLSPVVATYNFYYCHSNHSSHSSHGSRGRR